MVTTIVTMVTTIVTFRRTTCKECHLNKDGSKAEEVDIVKGEAREGDWTCEGCSCNNFARYTKLILKVNLYYILELCWLRNALCALLRGSIIMIRSSYRLGFYSLNISCVQVAQILELMK